MTNLIALCENITMTGLNKKYLIVSAVVIILLVLGGLILYSQQKSQAYKKVLADNEALLIISDDQGKERWFKGEVIEGMTVSDALKTSSLAGGFNFEANWHCLVNGREVQKSLDQEPVNPKDKISCIY